MIQINIETNEMFRRSIPLQLYGLADNTLRNLQTELNPVPEEFKDIEFWDEVDATPTFDSATYTLDGTETLTADAETKTVKVVRGVRAKTDEELAAERKALVPFAIKKWRGQVVLHRRSLLEQVEAIIVQSPEMNIIYKNVTDFERDNTLIAAIASVMGWDNAYIDEFFIEASKVAAG